MNFSLRNTNLGIQEDATGLTVHLIESTEGGAIFTRVNSNSKAINQRKIGLNAVLGILSQNSGAHLFQLVLIAIGDNNTHRAVAGRGNESFFGLLLSGRGRSGSLTSRSTRVDLGSLSGHSWTNFH